MHCFKCSKNFSSQGSLLNFHLLEGCLVRFERLKRNVNVPMFGESSTKGASLSNKLNWGSNSLQKIISKSRIDQPCVSFGDCVEKINSALKFRIGSYRFSGN